MRTHQTMKIGDRRRVYKLLPQDLTSFGGYSWSTPGQIHRFSGKGPICGPGHAHAYTSPALALFLRGLHNGPEYCRLFPGTGVVSATDSGLQIGVRELILDLDAEITVPLGTPSDDELVTFAIWCALTDEPTRAFEKWAENWLAGQDRTVTTAYAMAESTKKETSAWAAAKTAAWAVLGGPVAAVEAAAWAAAGAVKTPTKETATVASLIGSWRADMKRALGEEAPTEVEPPVETRAYAATTAMAVAGTVDLDMLAATALLPWSAESSTEVLSN